MKLVNVAAELPLAESRPMISIVIPARNAAGTLADCLQAIRDSRYADYEIVVVDDASTDATAQVAEQYGGRVVRCGENRGAAEAKNIGAREARGELIVFTDADIVLQPDTLTWIAQDMANATVIGVVGLLGKRLRYGDFASQFKNLWMYYTYSRLAHSRAAQEGVGLFFTSLAAIHRDVFLNMGGFDTHYHGASVTEDIEFGQRLLTAGHKVQIDARLAVEHLKHYTLRGLLKTDLQRAFGLSKTLLRKTLDSEQRATGQRYYASVPWFFALGVPLAWLVLLFAVVAAVTHQSIWMWVMLLTYGVMLLFNAPLLRTLIEVRGWRFGAQSCLFLLVDLWVSGLGVLWAIVDYGLGRKY